MNQKRFSVSTTEEYKGQVRIARENSLDFQTAYFPSSPGYPALPVVMIDEKHRGRAFVKRTPWLSPGKYGTRYSIMWHIGIPHSHPALNVVFSNDETGERKEFWLTICPLQLYVLKGMSNAFTKLANVITQTYGKEAKNVPFLIISEQAYNLVNGRNIVEVMTKNGAFFEDNAVIIQSSDFSLFCNYFQFIWPVISDLPPTEFFVNNMCRVPCRYCEISKTVLKAHNRIISAKSFQEVLDRNENLAAAIDKMGIEIESFLSEKMNERSKDMNGSWGKKL